MDDLCCTGTPKGVRELGLPCSRREGYGTSPRSVITWPLPFWDPFPSCTLGFFTWDSRLDLMHFIGSFLKYSNSSCVHDRLSELQILCSLLVGNQGKARQGWNHSSGFFAFRSVESSFVLAASGLFRGKFVLNIHIYMLVLCLVQVPFLWLANLQIMMGMKQ